MNLREYERQLKEWKTKYATSQRARENNFRFEPARIRVSCVRCGRTRPRMNRHHIRNDFYFALLLPDIYAPRYIQFHDADIATLCRQCHKACHDYYKPVVQQMYEERTKRAFAFPSESLQNKIDWCEEWKKKFELMFGQWLKRYNKNKLKRNRKNKNVSSP